MADYTSIEKNHRSSVTVDRHGGTFFLGQPQISVNEMILTNENS